MHKLLITSLLSTGLLLAPAAFAASGDKPMAKPATTEAAMPKLPADKEALLKQAKEEGRKEFEENQPKIKALYGELRTLLESPTFDKKAYMDKVKQLEDLKVKLATDHASRIADVAAKLTPEERKIVAQHMKDMHHGGPHHGPHRAPDADHGPDALDGPAPDHGPDRE